MIRVVLPPNLRALAHVDGEIAIDAAHPTVGSVIDAIEAQYPMLRGTIRDLYTQRRRSYVRIFACERDLSHEPLDATLPDAVTSGSEPLLIVGAIAGG